MSVAETLDTRRLGYVYDLLEVFRDGVAPAGTPAKPDLPRRPLASETLRVPLDAGRCTLRIIGVLTSDRPMNVEIAMARPDDPASAISVGAIAIGRTHGTPPVFPDSEPRFDVSAAVRLLAAPTVTVSVLPLALGPGQRPPPPFTYSGMAIVAAPA